MSVDPTVLEAVAAAVAADPSNAALRVHYGTLLLDSLDPAAALEQARAVLAVQPASLDALGLAHRAAYQAGEEEAALGYRRLLSALGGAPAPLDGSPADAVPPPPPPTGRMLSAPSSTEVPDDLSGLGAFQAEDEPLVEDPDVERPRLTLADVAGMAAVKERLELAFLGPARNPELSAAFGATMRGGLLLYGPPGCGKTYIARALAGELGAAFFAVGIADVLDMWVGTSERNLHEVFETARRTAPCVLFFDEIDALGQKRSHLRNSSSMRSTVNQLLVEMDGVGSSNDGVFVLAASNQPWDVDSALRRPGRFDRTLLVVPPDAAAREAILIANLRDKPVAERLDVRRIAKVTDGWSGADLAHLCSTAAERALAASMAEGKVVPIDQKGLERAQGELRASTSSWFDTASNVANFANENGQYDDLLAYLRGRR